MAIATTATVATTGVAGILYSQHSPSFNCSLALNAIQLLYSCTLVARLATYLAAHLATCLAAHLAASIAAL